ncbi:MAG: purine-nucleoside phosphorylase [Eubacterium sp.]|nr:purine-nucleoside phosphorylase [Eubacterium sp.]
MSQEYKKLEGYIKSIREKTDMKPDVAIILGSGLDAFVDCLDNQVERGYRKIPGHPICTNAAHRGRYVFGNIGDTNVVVLEGRLHHYEGYSMNEVVTPVRVARMLGAKTLIITNAAGGINLDFDMGTMMAITDQIASLVPSPLVGEDIEELGTRFPDMTYIYDKDLTKSLIQTANDLGYEMKKGVYIQDSGPNYESPAEVKAYRIWGADAVGMSTAVEAIAASHCGFKIVGLSCIANKAADINDGPLDDAEVISAVNGIAGKVNEILIKFIEKNDFK